MRRAGRVLTGVDRVEFAYLRHLLSVETPCFGLVRSPFGYVLLDRSGMQGFEARISGRTPWSSPDMLSWFARGQTPTMQRAQSDVRRMAMARCAPARLGAMLQRHVPRGASYLNTGHSNLTPRVLRTIKQTLGGSTGVFVHDVIPLEYPQYQRAGTVEPFAEKMRQVQAHADLIICNSADTLTRAQAVLAKWGQAPEGIVAHLGTDVIAPDVSQLPEGLSPKAPYFVVVGTIEPRKNHALLLDIWEQDAPENACLVICGSRGWNNEAVFDRIERISDGSVIEVAGLNDAALSALVASSNGLLFPSFAEGFGLPAVEAAALGVPVVCNDLPALREVLGNIPIYASVSDRYLWKNTIRTLASAGTQRTNIPPFSPPTWSDHFNIVLRMI